MKIIVAMAIGMVSYTMSSNNVIITIIVIISSTIISIVTFYYCYYYGNLWLKIFCVLKLLLLNIFVTL